MSHSPDIDEVYDRAADLAVRILNGARPADLPFEQPNPFLPRDQQKDLRSTRPDNTGCSADESR
jgi:hypothetical protein